MRVATIVLICAVALPAQMKHTHSVFTPSSAIFQQDEHLWYIGAEAVLAPPVSGTWLTDADLKFSLPPNGTITAVEATVSFASPSNHLIIPFWKPRHSLSSSESTSPLRWATYLIS